MTKFKYLLLPVLLLTSIQTFACWCGPSLLTDNYQRSAFVAKIKILKITPDTANAIYHDAVIETLTLYKGQRLSKIKIASELNTSCAFMPKENSTWLVFASVWQDVLSFGMCSGSIDVDAVFDPVIHPNAAKNYPKWLAVKEQALKYLASSKIEPNPAGIQVFGASLEGIKGYRNKNTFAVFKVDVDSFYKVSEISTFKKFKNGRLNKAVLDAIKKSLLFKLPSGKNPKKGPASFYLFCYFYEDKDPAKNVVTSYSF